MIVLQFENIGYIVSKPLGFKESERYPTVIFMHGAGTRGNDLEKLSKNPFFKEHNILLKKAIIYAPLCSEDTWFDIFESVRRFARFVSENKNTDKSRLYLIGASMGAYAVWQMLRSDPEMYAAAIPICGGGIYWGTERMKSIPVWAFHGKLDDIVLCEESIKMTDAINRAGGSAKLTILDEYGHSSWTYVYSNPEPFKWLLECRKEDVVSKIEEKFVSSEEFG